MKKWIGLLLAAALLALGLAACAEGNTTLDMNDSGRYDGAMSMCYVGDTLYILGGSALHAYDGETMTVCVDLADTAMQRYNPVRPEDSVQAAIWDRAIGHIFTDGETVYGLHPYSGEVFEVADGELVHAGQVPQELLYASEEDIHREIQGVACAGGGLALLLGTDTYEEYDKTELAYVDFVNGTHTVSAIAGIKSIAACGDGLFVYILDSEGTAVWRCDAKGEALSGEVVRLEADGQPSGFQAFGEGAVYLDGSRVCLTDGQGGAAVKAYVPVQYAYGSAPAACSSGGMYAYAYSNYVFLRDISGEDAAQQTVITVAGSLSPQTIIEFCAENPDIAVDSRDIGDEEALLAAAVSKDADIDVFVLSAPGGYAGMLDGGYLAPVESETLIGQAAMLYPGIQEAVLQDGQLYAYPLRVAPRCWMVNETKWSAYGLGEYPQTFTNVLAMTDLWYTDFAADYPDDALAELQQAGLKTFLCEMVYAYILENEENGAALTFDTPQMRQALADAAQYAYLFDSDHEMWGMPMLSSNYMGFGHTYTDRDRNRMIRTPGLSQDSKQHMFADAQLLAVSAASQHKDAAVRFIEFCAQSMTAQTKYEMMPSLMEPVENPRYTSRVAEVNAEIDSLRAQHEAAKTTQERDTISGMIAEKERMLASLEDARYTISAEDIAVYREMAEGMEIPYRSAYFGDGGGMRSLDEVIARFAGDGFEASEIDAMIMELDRVAHMVSAEGGK